MSSNETLLEVNDLKKYFPIRKGFFRRTVANVRAVDGVSFCLRRGETLGIVGESGCGKTTLIKNIIRAQEPTSGQILLYRDDGVPQDLVQADKPTLRRLRRNVQMVFQDPYSSLDPRQTVRDIIGEPLLVHGLAKGKEIDQRVRELMHAVGLESSYLKRYPFAFSGGQRQRIGVARALALQPKLILADEPTSALDVSVQAQLLNLLVRLQDEFSLTYIFISHDLDVVRHISDRVAVMYIGKIIEIGNADDLFLSPKHPYTEALLAAIPRIHPKMRRERIVLSGDVADPAEDIPGCRFHPRCRYVADICRHEVPPLMPLADAGSQMVACHRAQELSLSGIEDMALQR